jgi:hypothetical protein
MQSNWSWVIVSYVITTIALAGYTWYLRGRVREAQQALQGAGDPK